MSYIQKKLTEGEELVYSTRPHWIVLIKPFLKLLVLIVLLSVIEGNQLYTSIPWRDSQTYQNIIQYKNIAYGILVVFFLLRFLVPVIHKYTTEIGITNQRILSKRGWLAIDLQGMPLNKIENVDSQQSLMGRIFNYGDVMVKGSGSTPLNLIGISRPMRLRQHLSEQRDVDAATQTRNN